MADEFHRTGWHVSRTFVGDVSSVSAARHFCSDQFTESAPEGTSLGLDALELIASELVTNAVVAGASEVRVELSRHATAIRIVVHDDAPGLPEARQAELTDEHGRGLAFVAAFATRFGTEGTSGAKYVWADVATA